MFNSYIYRNAAGAEAQLSTELVPDRNGKWWSVSLVRTNGSVVTVAGQPLIVWFRTRGKAREAYGERLKALREAGWVRVE